jgi:AraC-like DNA-binding protein
VRAPETGTLARISGVAEVAIRITTRYPSSPHFHETYSIGLFARPTTIWCRGALWAVGPGRIAMLEPFEVHGGAGDARECPQDLLYPDPRLLFELFGSARPAHFPTPVVEDGLLALEFSAAIRSAKAAQLGDALRILFDRYAIPGLRATSSRRERERMSSQIGTTGSVAANARSAGLSRHHFSRRMRVLTGLSPSEYRRQQRVLAACEMIEKGCDLSHSAIDAGFADQAHMTRQMRSMLGFTPGVLQRISRKCELQGEGGMQV